MKPKKFEQCNKVWGAPPGQEDNFNAMHAYQGIEDGSGWPVTISAWVVNESRMIGPFIYECMEPVTPW